MGELGALGILEALHALPRLHFLKNINPDRLISG